MTDLQLELTKLIGSKELSFGCYIYHKGGFNILHRVLDTYSSGVLIYGNREIENNDIEIIGHPATLSDFEMWMESKGLEWEQRNKYTDKFGEAKIMIWGGNGIYLGDTIKYDPSKYLLDQPEENLKAIIEFIKSYT